MTQRTLTTRVLCRLSAGMVLFGASTLAAQAAAVPYVKADTSGMQVRLLALQWSARRQVLLADDLSTGTVGLRGVEALVLGQAAGIMFRYTDGTVGTAKDREVDARVVLGDGESALELGVVQRTMPDRPDTASNLIRAGMRLSYPIGGSGASVQFAGGGMYAAKANDVAGTDARKNDWGWDAETVFRYRPARWNIPAEIMVGYRMAVLRTARHEEERGVVMLGGGLSLSGR
jgi:hypothetical protein